MSQTPPTRPFALCRSASSTAPRPPGAHLVLDLRHHFRDPHVTPPCGS